MKKNLKYTLIMLAVLVVLGGGLAALLLFPAQQEEAPASSSETSSAEETVMERDSAEVASVEVEGPEGSYTLVPVGDGENFTVEGFEDLDVVYSSVNNSVNSLVSIHSSKNLGSRDNLEDFGLSGENATRVTLTYEDGGSDQLVLGGTAAESTGRYVLKDGSVYIASALASQLFGNVCGYLNTELYTIGDRTEETTDEDGNASTETLEDILYNLKLSGANFPEPIEITYHDGQTGTYMMSSPVLAESGNGTFTTLVESLKAPTATGVAAAKPTEEQLEEYGLAEPAATAEFDLNNETHTLSVSKADKEGTRYLLLDDRDVIYTVSDDTVSAWADTTVMKLRMSYIWIENITNVERLTLTVEGDMVYRYDVTRTKNEETSTEDSITYDLTIQNAGGETVDYENYQGFYKQLIAVAALNTDKPEYGGTPELTIRYEQFDGGTDTVEYYAVGEDRYAAEINGQFGGQVRRSELDKLIGLLPTLDANGAIED